MPLCCFRVNYRRITLCVRSVGSTTNCLFRFCFSSFFPCRPIPGAFLMPDKNRRDTSSEHGSYDSCPAYRTRTIGTRRQTIARFLLIRHRSIFLFPTKSVGFSVILYAGHEVLSMILPVSPEYLFISPPQISPIPVRSVKKAGSEDPIAAKKETLPGKRQTKHSRNGWIKGCFSFDFII